MNRSGSAIGVAFALALLISIPLGATTPPTVTFNFTDVEGESLAGVYTSPYLGNINGGSTIPVICDDFSDNTYLPEESWTAYETTLNTIDSSTPPSLSYLKWNGANSQGSVDGQTGWDLTQSQAYTVAAILAIEILQQNNTTDPTSPTNNGLGSAQQQKDLSFALWELFDPNPTAGLANRNWGSNNDSVTTWGPLASGDLATATQDVEDAIAASATALDGYTVKIYSYNGPPVGPGLDPPTCNGGTCPPPPQEFIALTPSGQMYNKTNPIPEPSSLAALGVYSLFGGVSLLFFGRRRIRS